MGLALELGIEDKEKTVANTKSRRKNAFRSVPLPRAREIYRAQAREKKASETRKSRKRHNLRRLGGVWVKNIVFKYVKLHHIMNTLLFTELKKLYSLRNGVASKFGRFLLYIVNPYTKISLNFRKMLISQNHARHNFWTLESAGRLKFAPE